MVLEGTRGPKVEYHPGVLREVRRQSPGRQFSEKDHLGRGHGFFEDEDDDEDD
jgi:hypothetical protein